MRNLLPDQLKSLWKAVDERRLTPSEFEARKQDLMTAYKTRWRDALILEREPDLHESLLSELGRFLGVNDPGELEKRCRAGVSAVRTEWDEKVQPENSDSVVQFYDKSQAYLYDLIWWHTLADDNSPLAYVLALEFVQGRGLLSHLDFGAGIGSGSILFARNGFETTLADISSTLLEFSRWRLDRRGLRAQLIDLKTAFLPSNAFDIITAMDVFEHLVDPVATVEQLARALKQGGFLFGRFDAGQDADHPQHIVRDFTPTLKRMQELGLVEVWRDEWLWGHRVFEKRAE